MQPANKVGFNLAFRTSTPPFDPMNGVTWFCAEKTAAIQNATPTNKLMPKTVIHHQAKAVSSGNMIPMVFQ